MEHEYCNTITIPITDIAEEKITDEKYFFVILKSPDNATTNLGDPSVAKITIISDHRKCILHIWYIYDTLNSGCANLNWS